MKLLVALLLMSGQVQAQEQITCDSVLADLQACNADLDRKNQERLIKDREIRDLESILRSEDHQRDLRQCRHTIRRTETEIEAAENELRPLEQQLSRVESAYQQKVRELERKKGRVVQYECLVSDKKYGENGVGVGRSEKLAKENAIANVRIDQIVSIEKRIQNAKTPSERLRLMTEKNNLIRYAQAAKKNGVYTYCYAVYANDRDKLNQDKIQQGPERANQSASNVRRDSGSGGRDGDNPQRPKPPRRPPNRDRG